RRRPTLAALLALVPLALVAAGAWLLLYARYQDQRARFAEQELQRKVGEQRRLDDVRAQAQTALLEGQAAFARGDWPAARADATRVLDRVGDAAGLDALRTTATDLRKRAEAKLADQAARARGKARLAQFESLREEALFHSVQVAGLDPAASRTRA